MKLAAHECADTLTQAHLFWGGLIGLRRRVLPTSSGEISGLRSVLRLSRVRHACRGRLWGREHIIRLLVGAEWVVEGHALTAVACRGEGFRRLARSARTLVLLFNRDVVVDHTRVAVVQAVGERGFMGYSQAWHVCRNFRHGNSELSAPIIVHKIGREEVLCNAEGSRDLAACYALWRELGWLYEASRDLHECLCNVGSKSGGW
jgi:hypothetical protein